MKKQDAINLMFNQEEKEILLEKLPNEWEKLPAYRLLVHTGLDERYVMSKETELIDLHHQSLITLRMALLRMSELLTAVKNEPNDQVLCENIRKMILNLENEFNISENE